jgi:hypothetical protein
MPSRGSREFCQSTRVSGYNYALGAFAWGTLSHAQTLHSLRLFAEEVMPAFS